MSNSNRNEPLKPYFEVERPPCPFYGFHATPNFLVDQKGNQCALITDSYSPCQMEMGEEEPNWELCPLRRDDIEILRSLGESAKTAKAFPREFHPPKLRQWEGIPLTEWVDYVSNKN